MADGLPVARTLHLEPLDAAARAAAVLLEPGGEAPVLDLVPGTYRATLVDESVPGVLQGALRVRRSLPVVDAPGKLAVDVVRALVFISGGFVEDSWPRLLFERVDDGRVEEVWPAATQSEVPALLTPGTYRVRLEGSYREEYDRWGGTVDAVLDPHFVVGAESQVGPVFEVRLHEETFVADVPAFANCVASWRLRSPEGGHVVEASGPCAGAPIVLPSPGPWEAQVTPMLDYEPNRHPVDLGVVDGGGAHPVPLHRLGVTVTLDGAPIAAEASVSPGFYVQGTRPPHDGTFESLLTPGDYRVFYRPTAPSAPPGWHLLEEHLEVTGSGEVSLELGPAVDLELQAVRNGVPVSSGELPHLWLVDEDGVARAADEHVTVRPDRHGLAASGLYSKAHRWPEYPVMLQTAVEVGAEAPQIALPVVWLRQPRS